MLRIEALPAEYGDCLWIEYGDPDRPSRILIDGGTISTYEVIQTRLEMLPKEARVFELFIITHIDADHIGGAIRLLGNIHRLGVTFKDIWFNGWKHLPVAHDESIEGEWLAGTHGEFLSALIELKNLPWNNAFNGSAVAVGNGPLPCCKLADGMTLTLVSPTFESLVVLRNSWQNEVRAAGLDRSSVRSVLDVLKSKSSLALPDDLFLGGEGSVNIAELASQQFFGDASKSNASSIAVLMEYEDKQCLLTGDAHATVLYETIQRLLCSRKEQKLALSVLKLPHHGSKGNINIPFLNLIACSHFLISTNGKRYYHPDPEAVARVIVYGGFCPTLYFNYYTDTTKIWADAELTNGDYSYKVEYAGNNGICLYV